MSHGVRLYSGLALLFAVAIAAHPAFAGNESHIRITEPRLAALFDRGLAESPTFRRIVTQLDAQPLLVFIRCQPYGQRGPSAAGLTFLARTSTYRYVRVFMTCELPAATQLPLLAHELQHALEVAAAPDVVDTLTLRRHYEQIGYRSSPDDDLPSFDTAAAIDVQRRVTLEMSSGSGHAVAHADVRTPHTWE